MINKRKISYYIPIFIIKVILLFGFVGVSAENSFLKEDTRLDFDNAKVRFTLREPTYTLTVKVKDRERGEVQSEIKYGKKEEAIVKASPQKGFYFSRWEKEGVIVSREKEHSFLLEKDTEIMAVFEKEVDFMDERFLSRKELQMSRINEAKKRSQDLLSIVQLLLREVKESDIRNKLNEIYFQLEEVKDNLELQKEELEIKIERFLRIREENKKIISQKKRAQEIRQTAIDLLPIVYEKEEIRNKIVQIIKEVEKIEEKIKEEMEKSVLS